MSKWTVWKYPLTDKDVHLDLPFGAEVVNVGTQFVQGVDIGHIWVRLDTEMKTMETRIFHTVETGAEVDPAWHYVGTFRPTGTGLVLHVFEEPPVRRM